MLATHRRYVFLHAHTGAWLGVPGGVHSQEMSRTVSQLPSALSLARPLLTNRAWELLVNAQRQSRDADIFRRVVDRIKVCVEEATAPATAAAAAASSGLSSRPGSPPLPPPAPTDHGNASRRKKGKSGAAAGDGPSGAGGSDAAAPCNWALAHAACRVCRVVGRTFQVAIRCVFVQRLHGGREKGGKGGGGGVSGGSLIPVGGFSTKP